MAELKDLVQFALDKQPSKFKDAFAELVAGRVVDKVDELKSEISANMFGEAPEEDEDEFDDEDVNEDDVDDVLDDEDLDGLIDFDLDDEDMPTDDEDGEIDFDLDDEETDEDDIDEEDETFHKELVDAIKEDTTGTHRLDSMEARSSKGGGMTIGVRDNSNNRISGYVHVGPKVDKTGKPSMFGSHNKMTYSQVGKGSSLSGPVHDLGVRKFSQRDLESTISSIHKTGK